MGFQHAHLKGKTLEQIIESLDDAQPQSPVYEIMRAAVYAVPIRELTDAVKNSTVTAAGLNRRLIWLNIVLTAIAVVVPILVVLKV